MDGSRLLIDLLVVTIVTSTWADMQIIRRDTPTVRQRYQGDTVILCFG